VGVGPGENDELSVVSITLRLARNKKATPSRSGRIKQSFYAGIAMEDNNR
jgi:hypothetical protein